MLPPYSVVIPVYNAEVTLRDTVISALQQTHPPAEILLMDDGSTDQSPIIIQELAKEYPQIRVHRNEDNCGVAETRNSGFAAATGSYVALLDADDQWMPDKMERQLTLMLEQKCDFSYTGYSMIHPGNSSEKVYHVPKSLSYRKMLTENYVGCSTVVLTKEVAQSYRMSREYLHEDYVLWLQLLKDGKIACGIDLPLMRYRLASGRSANKRNAAAERWKIYRKELNIPLLPAVGIFACYAANGIRKHRA